MKKRFINILLAMGLLVYGCSSDNELTSSFKTNQLISLNATVSSPMVTTRTAVEATPYNESVPGPYSAIASENKSLDAAVWFTDVTNHSSHTYSEGSGTTYPRHSSILFTSEGAAYPVDALQYPDQSSTLVYCVGLYPKTGWSTLSSDTKATHAINGEDDLMFAPEISGSYVAHIGTLEFEHQLTWLKIYVNAQSTRAIEAWGKLKKITVTSPGSNLIVDFTTSSASCDNNPTPIIAFDNGAGVDLTVTNIQYGSVFCAPATSYDIKVETANFNDGNSKSAILNGVTLKGTDGITPIATADAAKGKMFIITLNIKEINEINATVTLSEMTPDSETLTLK